MGICIFKILQVNNNWQFLIYKDIMTDFYNLFFLILIWFIVNKNNVCVRF